jgi:hypothetical protein
MNLKNPFPIALFSLACLFLTACGSKAVSDQTLATDIQAKLYADQTAKAANVKVAVSNGVVTLSGDAPSADVALQVVNIANGVSGIKSVDNQLKVAGVSAAAQLPPAMPDVAPVASGSAPASAPPVQQPQNMQPPPPVAQAPPPPAPAAPPKPVSITVPAGTDIGVRMIDSISSKTNTTGQTFRASLSEPLVVDGETIIPAGAPVSVLLAEAKGAGRIKGNSELEVRAVSIERHGHSYNIDTNVNEQVGKGRGKQSAVRTGVGAAAGAIIGALAGGGKGAAIGSLAGGGAGAGFQLATHGQQVSIPSETVLTFRLQAPLVVKVRGAE